MNVDEIICPYAKDIGFGHIRGCTLSPTPPGEKSGGTIHLLACPEICYNGEYKKCPRYVDPEETEK